MRKILILSALFLMEIRLLEAHPITIATAQRTAETLYRQNFGSQIVTLTLAYTELTAGGMAAYFAFNINQNDGFIILSADDAAHPLIGYSVKGRFVFPEIGSPIANWLNNRKKEIETIQSHSISADQKIKSEWAGDLGQQVKGLPSIQSSTAISPMVQTTWNQSPWYNALCPGNSVTGCVATAMAQIMKFWNYPFQGLGSSSYCDCSPNYSNNYGPLSVNYATTTYDWAAMPLNVSSANSAVATLMYDCGVSVDMNYSPSSSGAWVISGDNPICAQNSYVQYFRYNPQTIQGLYRYNYSDSAWMQLLDSELINGRVVQYAGWDTVEGGHTWVLDGVDQNYNFHMNWGWGGADDGYYSINNLNTGGYNFVASHEAIIGIQPMHYAMDAGIQAIVFPKNPLCDSVFNPVINLQNDGLDTLTSCMLNYQLDQGSVQTQVWSGILASGQSTLVTLSSQKVGMGNHSLLCFTNLPNGKKDTIVGNNQSTTYFSYKSLKSSFSTNQTSFCFVPANLQFLNNSENATSYLWNFGNGVSSYSLDTNCTFSAPGTYTVTLISKTCNGTETDSSKLIVSIVTPAAPTVTISPITSCGPDSFTLTANGNGTIFWEDSLGTQLATGSEFITPTISKTTTYYAVSELPNPAIYGGPSTINTLGSGGYLNFTHYLIFNVYSALTLLTVDIYADFSASSNPAILLEDSLGNVLQMMTPASVHPGQNTVILNWAINAGSGYRLVAAGSNINLYRNALTSGKIPYPIAIGPLASITGDDADSAHYYWFYNWQVQAQSCTSEAVPVLATVINCLDGIINFNTNSSVVLFPNPANGTSTIRSDLPLGMTTVYNSIGELVYKNKTNETELILDLSQYPPGLYVVRVQNQFMRLVKI